jgi:hypothetical protein
MRRKRRTAISFSALVGALLIAGCGSAAQTPRESSLARSPSSPSAQAVSRAARHTLSMTASVAFRLDGARAFGPARAPVFGRATFDLPAGNGTALIDLPEAARQELGNEHAIIFPTRVYLQPKGTSSGVLPRGKLWVSATIVGSESVSTNFPQFVGGVEAINPALGLSELALGTAAARRLGPELIGRIPAQRYRVSVDLARALARLSGPAAPALGAAIQQQLAAGASAVPFYVWIDGAGRVVEYQAAFPGSGDGRALIELHPFGVRTRVAPPNPVSVVDITALAPSGERENSGGGDSDGG